MSNLSSGYWNDGIRFIDVLPYLFIVGLCVAIWLLGTSVEDRLDVIENDIQEIQWNECYCGKKVVE